MRYSPTPLAPALIKRCWCISGGTCKNSVLFSFDRELHRSMQSNAKYDVEHDISDSTDKLIYKYVYEEASIISTLVIN